MAVDCLLNELDLGFGRKSAFGAPVFLAGKVALYAPVATNRSGADRARQHQPLEGSATTQGHVGLAGGEHAVQVNDHAVEGLPLALVNGHRPGQAERELGKSPRRTGHNNPVPGLEPDQLPFVRLHPCPAPGFGQSNDDVFLAGPDLHVLDPADAAVDPALRAIVVQHHYLGAGLEAEPGLGRVVLSTEIAADQRLKEMLRGRKSIQAHPVDHAGCAVGAGQGDVTLAFRRLEMCIHPLVQPIEVAIFERVLADSVQQAHELAVTLAEYSSEFDHLKFNALQRPGAEKMRRGVDLA